LEAIGDGQSIRRWKFSKCCTRRFARTDSAGAIQQYSLSQNGGAGVNCALSFQFQ